MAHATSAQKILRTVYDSPSSPTLDPGVANLELHIKNVASLDGGVSDTLESYMLTSHCNTAPSPQHCTSYMKNTSTLVTLRH